MLIILELTWAAWCIVHSRVNDSFQWVSFANSGAKSWNRTYLIALCILSTIEQNLWFYGTHRSNGILLWSQQHPWYILTNFYEEPARLYQWIQWLLIHVNPWMAKSKLIFLRRGKIVRRWCFNFRNLTYITTKSKQFCSFFSGSSCQYGSITLSPIVAELANLYTVFILLLASAADKTGQLRTTNCQIRKI